MKIIKKQNSTLEAVRLSKIGIYEGNRLLISVDGKMPLWLLNNLLFYHDVSGGIGISIGCHRVVNRLDYAVYDGKSVTVLSTEAFRNLYDIIEEDK